MTWRPHMPQLSRALPPLLAGVALAVAGCGGDEEGRGLTGDKSDRLIGLLDDAEEQFEGGNCDELTGTLTTLADEVNQVDTEVEEGVRSALSTETQELVNLASQDCQVVQTTTETAPPTTVFTEPPTTEETETEETETEEEPPGEGPDGEGPPGQDDDDDSESGLKPPKEPKEPDEEAAAPGGET